MKCPKCGEDLIHLSGRYLCSDCGNEVPESEVSVGGWNFSDDGSKGDEIPGNVQVNNFDDAITDSDDYLVEYKTDPETTESGPESQEESKLEDKTSIEVQDIVPEGEVVAAEQPIGAEAQKGFYTAADMLVQELNEGEAVKVNVQEDEALEPQNQEITINPELEKETRDDIDPVLSKEESVQSSSPEEMLNNDLLDSQDSQAPVTIAPIDEELLISPMVEDGRNEDSGAVNGTKSAMPSWIKWFFVGILVLILAGGFIYLIWDYISKNNTGTNTEIQNPNSTSWLDYKNTEHSFGIYLPERPKSAKSTLKVGNQDLVATVFESSEGENNIYRIHVLELTDSLSKLENDDLMTLLAENFTKKDDYAISSQEEVSVDTAFGLDIEAKNDQNSLKSRLVRIENKVYILSLVYNNGESTEKYQDFVRSFKIIQESI